MEGKISTVLYDKEEKPSQGVSSTSYKVDKMPVRGIDSIGIDTQDVVRFGKEYNNELQVND